MNQGTRDPNYEPLQIDNVGYKVPGRPLARIKMLCHHGGNFDGLQHGVKTSDTGNACLKAHNRSRCQTAAIQTNLRH